MVFRCRCCPLTTKRVYNRLSLFVRHLQFDHGILELALIREIVDDDWARVMLPDIAHSTVSPELLYDVVQYVASLTEKSSSFPRASADNAATIGPRRWASSSEMVRNPSTRCKARYALHRQAPETSAHSSREQPGPNSRDQSQAGAALGRTDHQKNKRHNELVRTVEHMLAQLQNGGQVFAISRENKLALPPGPVPEGKEGGPIGTDGGEDRSEESCGACGRQFHSLEVLVEHWRIKHGRW